MTTKEELIVQGLKLEQELKKLQEQIENMDETEIKYPFIPGQLYWVLNSNGSMERLYATLVPSPEMLTGNAFLTYEDASKEYQLRRLRAKCRSLPGFFRPERVGGVFSAYSPYWDAGNMKWGVRHYSTAAADQTIFFKTEAEARNAISVLGSDLSALI